MNLYLCWYDDEDWGCYVFANTVGEARYLFNKFWDGDKDSFIDVRSAFIGKSQLVETPSVVDDENHKDYPAVLALGVGYTQDGYIWNIPQNKPFVTGTPS